MALVIEYYKMALRFNCEILQLMRCLKMYKTSLGAKRQTQKKGSYFEFKSIILTDSPGLHQINMTFDEYSLKTLVMLNCEAFEFS